MKQYLDYSLQHASGITLNRTPMSVAWVVGSQGYHAHLSCFGMVGIEVVNRHRPRQTFGTPRAGNRDCRPAHTSTFASADLPKYQSTPTHNRIALALHQSIYTMSEKAGPGVGFEFPSYEVSWMKRDLLLFATSIGATYPDELQFLYVSGATCPMAQRILEANCYPGIAPQVRCFPYIPNYPAFQAHGSRGD